MTKTGKKTLLIIILTLIVIGAAYWYHATRNSTLPAPEASPVAQTSGSPYTTKVSGNVLFLFKNGTEIQTLPLGDDAVSALQMFGTDSGVQPFLTTDDVNFDGYPDVAMLTGIGYGGVNAFYDYYVFDPTTERLVADPILTQICNPVFDASAKTVTGDAKDAQDSYKTVYTWNGIKYMQGPTVSDTTGQIQSDQ